MNNDSVGPNYNQLEESKALSSSITLEKHKRILSTFTSKISQKVIIISCLLSIVLLILSYVIQKSKADSILIQIGQAKQSLSSLDYDYQQSLSQLNAIKQERESLLQTLNNTKASYAELLLFQETIKGEYLRQSNSLKEFKATNNTVALSELIEGHSKSLLQLAQLKNKDNAINNKAMRGRISEILTEEQIKVLEQWTNKTLLFACFNNNIHSMTGKQFHSNCDMYSGTVSIVITQDATIGGYTSQDWTGNKDKFDDKAFVFNLNRMKKYHVQFGKVATCPREDDLFVFSYDIALTKNNYYVLFPSSYGSIVDKQEFGIERTTIKPSLVEVIVVY